MFLDLSVDFTDVFFVKIHPALYLSFVYSTVCSFRLKKKKSQLLSINVSANVDIKTL